jgi:hypothetical protein
MKSANNTHCSMAFPLEFADLAGQPGLGALRVGFVLTIIALAFIVRQPPKTHGRKGDK